MTVIYGDKSQNSGVEGILNEKGYERIFLGDKNIMYLDLRDD